MIKSNIMLTILNNAVKDTETNPKVFEPSALPIQQHLHCHDKSSNQRSVEYISFQHMASAV